MRNLPAEDHAILTALAAVTTLLQFRQMHDAAAVVTGFAETYRKTWCEPREDAIATYYRTRLEAAE